MRLIIVRHGETEWNKLRRVQGTTNTPLSPRGQKQARLVAKRLKGMRINAIFSSPLDRAKYTAKAIATACRAPVFIDESLKEINFGDWEGLTFEEIGARYPEQFAVWNTAPHLCVPAGKSETLAQVADRCALFVENLKKQYETGTVVAVSHSVPCKLMTALCVGLPFSKVHSLRMDNASVTMLDYYQDRNVLRTFNDTNHLMEEQAWQRR